MNNAAGTITYAGGQSIRLNAQGVPGGCTDTTWASQTLQVVDSAGRAVTYSICGHKLTKVASPNGGRVDYVYAASALGQQVWQGTDVYSLPILKMDVYNESSAGVKARSIVFNWNFQNGEVVKAVVGTYDKSAVPQGTNEYLFNSAAGTASAPMEPKAGQFQCAKLGLRSFRGRACERAYS